MQTNKQLKIAGRELERRRMSLHTAEIKYLRAAGWSQTCNTPGSIWMWVRDFSREDRQGQRNHDRLIQTVLDAGREPRMSPFTPMGLIMAGEDTAIAMTERFLEGFIYDD